MQGGAIAPPPAPPKRRPCLQLYVIERWLHKCSSLEINFPLPKLLLPNQKNNPLEKTDQIKQL